MSSVGWPMSSTRGGHAEELGDLASREHGGEGPDRGQGHQRHEKQRHDLPADRLPAKAHGLPQLDPPVGGTHVRQQTARAYYRPTGNSKARPEPELPCQGREWRVVRPLREIVCPKAGVAGSGSTPESDRAGWLKFFGIPGIFEESFVVLYGKRGRNRPQEPHPAPGRRKTAQAGQPLGSTGLRMRASGLLAVGSDTVMGTAERRGAPESGVAAQLTAPGIPRRPDRELPEGAAET